MCSQFGAGAIAFSAHSNSIKIIFTKIKGKIKGALQMYRFLSRQFWKFSSRKRPVSFAAQHERSSRGKWRSRSNGNGWRWQKWRNWREAGAPLLAFSWVTTFKNLLGTAPFTVDNDPLKKKIREVSCVLWKANFNFVL